MNTHADVPHPFARLVAYAIDWLVFGVWVGTVVAATLLLQDGEPAWPANPWLAQAAGFAFTTLPFGLYFALCEGSRRGATLGKRCLHLQVREADGQPAGYARAALRTLVKLLPWEIGHGAAYHIAMAPSPGPGPLALATSGLAGLLAFAYAVQLWRRDGRPPYDRIAGTRVVRFS
jgi:uncharacterized RDD family membrane protein YckC